MLEDMWQSNSNGFYALDLGPFQIEVHTVTSEIPGHRKGEYHAHFGSGQQVALLAPTLAAAKSEAVALFRAYAALVPDWIADLEREK